MLIRGEAKLKTRLNTMRKPICPARASMPRPRAITKVAPARPNTAPEAPEREAVRVDQHHAEGSGQQRGEVEDEEARRPQRRLEQPAEEVQEQEHVEADVNDAGVEEAAGDQAVPLAFGDEGAVEAEVDDELAALFVEQAAGAARDLDQEDDHVDRDQDVGGRTRLEAGGRRSGSAPPWCAGWRTPGSACRPGSGSCSRGRSAGRRRSRKRRSRGRGGGNRSRPSGKAAYNRRRWRPQPRPSLRRRGRRLSLRARRASASSTTRPSATSTSTRRRSGPCRSTAGSTSSTSPPARSACSWPASPRAPTR